MISPKGPAIQSGEPNEAEPRRPHDLGGLPLGPVDRKETPRTLYEMRVDALLMLLVNPAKGAFKVDALRRVIEDYSAFEYENLPYYDRWIKAIRCLVVEQGVLTDAQIDERIASIRAAGFSADRQAT